MKLLRNLAAVLSLVALVLSTTPAMADLCFNCGSGSSGGCKQCRSRSGKDTQKDRETCKDLGCKITGYSSCSTAANVKVCKAEQVKPVQRCSTYFVW